MVAVYCETRPVLIHGPRPLMRDAWCTVEMQACSLVFNWPRVPLSNACALHRTFRLKALLLSLGGKYISQTGDRSSVGFFQVAGYPEGHPDRITSVKALGELVGLFLSRQIYSLLFAARTI